MASKGPALASQGRLRADDIFRPGVSSKEHAAGWGLSLARTVLNRLGGSIELSDPKSARFTISIPLASRVAAPVNPTPAAGPVVLFVDDNRSSLSLDFS